MRDYISLGQTPPNEECIQVGAPNYRIRAIQECKKYIEVIRKMLGPEPEGAKLDIKACDHELGVYYDVVCYYDDENKVAAEYAFNCEANGPQTWDL